MIFPSWQVHLVPGVPSHVWLLSWVICFWAPNPTLVFMALVHRGILSASSSCSKLSCPSERHSFRLQYFVSHVLSGVFTGVADGSRPCSAWSSTAASTTIWWKWHGCRFRRFVIPWIWGVFFSPMDLGPRSIVRTTWSSAFCLSWPQKTVFAVAVILGF